MSKNKDDISALIEERYQWLKSNFSELETFENITYSGEFSSPMAMFLMAARAIAIELDKRYKNNIRVCQKLIIHRQLTGKPFVIRKKDFTNKEWNIVINNFPLFRDTIDYIVTQKVLGKLSKVVWNGKPTVTIQ